MQESLRLEVTFVARFQMTTLLLFFFYHQASKKTMSLLTRATLEWDLGATTVWNLERAHKKKCFSHPYIENMSFILILIEYLIRFNLI